MNNTKKGKAVYSDYAKHVEKTGKAFDFATIKAQLFNIATNVGFALLTTAAVKLIDTLHTTAEEYVETQDEIIQKANENIENYDGEISSLESLQKQLKDAKENKADLVTVTNALNKAIGETPGLINSEAEAYELANKKLEARIEYYKKLREQELDNIINANKNIFENNGVSNDSVGSVWDFFNSEFDRIANGSFNSYLYTDYIEGVKKIEEGIGKSFSEIINEYLANNSELSENEAAYQALKDFFGFGNLSFIPSQSEFDSLLSKQLSTLKSYYSDYISSYDGSIDDSLIYAFMEDMILGGHDLETISDKLKSILNDSTFEDLYTDYQLSFTDDSLNTEELYNSLKVFFDNLKKELPTASDEIDAFFDSMVTGIRTTSDELSSPDKITVFSTESFNKEIKSYEDNYKRLIQAQEEWNETQALSPSTFVELQESGLLEYLEYTSDGLKVNTDKLLENAESCKNKAVSDLQAAMTSDMLAIAIGNTSNISDTAQSVIEQLGNNVEIAGDKALNSVADWATLGETISGVLKKAGVEDINTDQWEQMSAVYDYYKNLADNISEIDITAPERKSGDSGTKSKTKETFDWIETTISRIQRTITNLGKTVSATYKQWSTRNNTLAQEMSAVTHEIGVQQQALNAYMDKANSVNLSEKYKEKIRNGSLSIDEVSDETVQENVKSYKEWYEKALECEDAITDLQDSLAELAQTKFDNISKQYDDRIAMIEHHTSMLEGYVNRAEVSGFWASEVYYQKLAETELDNINQLQSQYNDLITAFNTNVNNGSIEKYSEDWYSMYEAINDTEEAIQSANTALIEYNQTLQQIRWDLFDRSSDYKNALTEEGNFLIDMLDNYELFNKDGSMTNHGLSVQGLHAMNYNVYMEESAAYAKELQKINEEIANDPHDLELIDRRNELLNLQQEAIRNAMSEKEAIKDLAKNGFDKMLDSLQELIDKRKEALNAEKDLYDYQNSIKEKTDTISNYKKQLQSYAGDNSEEAKATIQKLQISLAKAEKDLAETEYEKWLSDQEALLDDLYDQTSEWINARLDNIDGLVYEAIVATNTNASTISNTLNEVTNALGYTLSTNMAAIWNAENAALNGVYNVVKTYGDILYGTQNTINNSINGGITTVQNALKTIDNDILKMIEVLNAQAKTQAESIAKAQQQSASSQSNNNSNSSNNTSVSTPTPEPTSNKITLNGGLFYENSYKGGKTGNSVSQWTGHEVEITGTSKTGMVHIVDKTTGTILGWVDPKQLNGYATGTINAKKGFNLISEAGDEIVLDNHGNAVLASGTQLYPFEGGETVFNAAKTAEILRNNLVPLNEQSFLSGMVKKPNYSALQGLHRSSGHISNDIKMNITLPNVTDYDSFVTQLKHDKRFEKLVQNLTIDRALNKNSLSKNKL